VATHKLAGRFHGLAAATPLILRSIRLLSLDPKPGPRKARLSFLPKRAEPFACEGLKPRPPIEGPGISGTADLTRSQATVSGDFGRKSKIWCRGPPAPQQNRVFSATDQRIAGFFRAAASLFCPARKRIRR